MNLDYEKIKATAITISAMRVFQQSEILNRNKNVKKIANSFMTVIGNKNKFKKPEADLCYQLELEVAKKTEKVLQDLSIDAVMLSRFLLMHNQQLISKYFKVNWNLVDKMVHLSDGTNGLLKIHVTSAFKYHRKFCELLDEEMKVVEIAMWNSWVLTNEKRFRNHANPQNDEISEKNLQIL